MTADIEGEAEDVLGEAEVNPPCHTCRGTCCRSYVVPVTGYDVWRISTTQRLAPESYLIAGNQTEGGPEGFLLEPDVPPFFLALDKRPHFSRYEPCIFLMTLAVGEERCGIYSHRPSACRVYPMAMYRGEVRLADHVICPPGSWPQSEISRPTWREAVKRTHLESDIYTEVVARWNARVIRNPQGNSTLHSYLSYLLNAHGSLMRLEEEIGDEKMARVEATWPTSPRVAANLDEMLICRGDFPWIDFLIRARAVIDRFYPEIPPQPPIFPMSSEA